MNKDSKQSQAAKNCLVVRLQLTLLVLRSHNKLKNIMLGDSGLNQNTG